MKVVIAGGTGFLGHALVREFAGRGDDVTVLSRSFKHVKDAKTIQWDAKNLGAWAGELENTGAVINVVGETVFTRWTDEKYQSMISSRVDSTKAIGQAIAKCKKPPPVWVNASAVGYYGSVYDPTNEWSPPGSDHLADICKQWEEAQQETNTPRTRKCQARMGFVLGQGGGAFPMLRKLTRLFLGSALGSGKHFVAWVHVEDVVGAIRFCVERQLEGPVNVVGPQAVTNAELMATLRKEMHRPWVPNVPKFILTFASAFALPPTEVTLASQNVFPERLKALEYPYRFPTLDSALEDLLK